MKTLIVGAGAVGGYFAASLHRGGGDVTLVARGGPARAIREHGLRIEAVGGGWTARLPVLESPGTAGGFDLAIVAVKAFALPEVSGALPAALRDDGVALSLCNGLGAEETLAAALSVGRVLGATALIGAERIAPGVIRHDARGIVVLGERWPGAGQVERIARFLAEHGVRVDVRDDIARAKWWKMAWNCAFNPITALHGWTVAQMMADAEACERARAVMAEVAAVAREAGVDLGPDIADQLLGQNADIGHVRTSMLQDLLAGRRSENEELCGEIVRRGRASGLAVPHSESLYSAVRARERR